MTARNNVGLARATVSLVKSPPAPAKPTHEQIMEATKVETLERIEMQQVPSIRGAEAISRVTGMSRGNVYKLTTAGLMPVFVWGGKLCGFRDLLYKWALNYRPKTGGAAKRSISAAGT